MPYGSRPVRGEAAEIAQMQKEFELPADDAGRVARLLSLLSIERASPSYGELREEYFTLWSEIVIRTARLTAVDRMVDKISAAKSRYAVIESATEVPWYIVAVIHAMEATLSFNTHLHNGDPLSGRTVNVPAGRPVRGNPPFSWEESAIDAIRYDRMDRVESWNIERLLYTLEAFNGFGYRKYHPEVKSPYLWSFSNHYTKGKYVADGLWSPEAVSQQCGAAVLLARMVQRNIIEDIEAETERQRAIPVSGEKSTEAPPDEEDGFGEDLDRLGSIVSHLADVAAARQRLTVDNAYWPDNPANAPDTWHLPAGLDRSEFDLTAEVIKSIARLGAFEPKMATNGRLILSLRGCEIADGSDTKIDQEKIRLRAVKPDHENFNCLIGVFDEPSGLISLYIASTVPRRTGMLKFYNKIHFGTAGPNCNMLPTGCYEHCVGTHGGSAGPVTFVLRLGDGPTAGDAGAATVLRTSNDLAYGTSDMWDNTRPGDNIHPAFLATSFSSLGCLTIRGHQSQDGDHSTATGEWSKFRKKAGFNGQNHGKRFDNLLITGQEASAIASALVAAAPTADLVCLRQGSRGPLVERLQTQLGLAADGAFGARTCEALVSLQQRRLGFATGTWTARMANMLGLTF